MPRKLPRLIRGILLAGMLLPALLQAQDLQVDGKVIRHRRRRYSRCKHHRTGNTARYDHQGRRHLRPHTSPTSTLVFSFVGYIKPGGPDQQSKYYQRHAGRRYQSPRRSGGSWLRHAEESQPDGFGRNDRGTRRSPANPSCKLLRHLRVWLPDSQLFKIAVNPARTMARCESVDSDR